MPNRRSKKRKNKTDSGTQNSVNNNDSNNDIKDDDDVTELNVNGLPPVNKTLIRRVSQEMAKTGYNEIDMKMPIPLDKQKSLSAEPRMATIRINRQSTSNVHHESLIPSKVFGDSEYRETMIYLLAFASYLMYPKRELVITSNFEFNLKKRSYFCRFVNIKHNLKNDLVKISNEIERLANLNIKLESKYFTLNQCIEHFKKTNQTYSVKLCETTNRQYYKVIGCKLPNSNKEYYILSYRGVLSSLKYCKNAKLYPHNKAGYFVLGILYCVDESVFNSVFIYYI